MPLAWDVLFVFVSHLQVNLHGHKNKNPHPAERDRDVFVEVASRVRVLQAVLAIKGAPPTTPPSTKPLAWPLLFLFVDHLQASSHGHKNEKPPIQLR